MVTYGKQKQLKITYNKETYTSTTQLPQKLVVESGDTTHTK